MRARYYKSIQLRGDVSWLNANSPHCGEIYSILYVVQQGRRVDLVSWKRQKKYKYINNETQLVQTFQFAAHYNFFICNENHP
jgi:hypothetical protein